MSHEDKIVILKYKPEAPNYAEYHEGRCAYYKGYFVQSCPYTHRTPEWEAWRHGYSVGALEFSDII